jgi:hypothetical protein
MNNNVAFLDNYFSKKAFGRHDLEQWQTFFRYFRNLDEVTSSARLGRCKKYSLNLF